LRSVELAKHGYQVLRFWNSDVIENVEGVLQIVLQVLEGTPPHPDPLRPHEAEREE